MTDDLLALMVEVTSIGVAGRKLKKPITVPRPGKKKPGRPVTPAEKDAAFKHGIGVLAASTKAVRR